MLRFPDWQPCMKIIPLSFAVVTILLAGCTRGVTSDPNLEEWTQSIKDKRPDVSSTPLPTLSKFKVFSYKDHMTKVVDPNPSVATMRADIMQPDTPQEDISQSEQAEEVGEIGGGEGEKENREDTNTTPTSDASVSERGTSETNSSESPPQVSISPTQDPVTIVLRNPFSFPVNSNLNTTALRPDPNRARQPLESFPLDGLKMVGTIGVGGRTALLMAPDKIVYRVGIGEYVGQQDGRIVDVQPGEVLLVELVPDGAGGWVEQSASIILE